MIKDVVIIGSGPAGLTCAIYTARAGRSTYIIAGNNPGGQLVNTDMIENFPGFESIRGSDLMMTMISQAEKLGAKFIYETAASVSKDNDLFHITLSSGEELIARTVLVATGAKHKHLGVSGEAEFTNKGVSWCATCDGPMYRDKTVAVVGGGNTAVMEAIFLSNFAKQVFLIHRRDTLRAEKVNQIKLLDNQKIRCIWNSEIVEINGSEKLESIKLKNNITKEIQDINIEGLFIAIGTIPSTDFLANIIDTDSEGYIITEHIATNVQGLFAAGDVVSGSLKQAVYAAGQGAAAAKQIEEYIG
ncbi:MAG: thioredoxin-disulfide reductase [Alphaproteobacteria bacterium]|nr:thioredoxin-disulfide reductase [Alphaproteobacteria bacterium]